MAEREIGDNLLVSSGECWVEASQCCNSVRELETYWYDGTLNYDEANRNSI